MKNILTQCIDLTFQFLRFLSYILNPCEMIVIFANIEAFKDSYNKNRKL